MSHSHEITHLLEELKGGKKEVLNELFPQVYAELRRVADFQLRKERDGHTLNATALIHEAYLKIADYKKMDWQSRAHFYAVAAQAMRQILVSYARKRNAEKRGGGGVNITFDEAQYGEHILDELVSLDEALTHLATINARHAKIIECRFFGGLSIEETAEALGVSTITVTRDWRMARAWLKEILKGSDEQKG